ncbi:MAG: SDR family NAD(P)-dependent oxidoreductase [Terricaulis sp.]
MNVASVAGVYGTPRMAVYSATKHAVRGLTEALDLEFARHGVRMTSLMPWFVETAILDGRHGDGNETFREGLTRGKVEDLSGAARGGARLGCSAWRRHPLHGGQAGRARTFRGALHAERSARAAEEDDERHIIEVSFHRDGNARPPLDGEGRATGAGRGEARKCRRQAS